MAQVAINWCIAKGAMPIPGAKNIQQAQDNIAAQGWLLDAGEIAELDRAAAGIDQLMVQNIFQSK
jgi:pyridoxine 4-dehydrogenase